MDASVFDTPQHEEPGGLTASLFDTPQNDAVSEDTSTNRPSYRVNPKALARAGMEAQNQPGMMEEKTGANGPGFGTRLVEGAKALGRGARALGKTAYEEAKSLPGSFVSSLSGKGKTDYLTAHPEVRRQLARGVDEAATLGYGGKLASRIGNALGDTPETALGPETFTGAPAANTQAADALAAPDARTAGNLLGAFTPGAASVAGAAGGKLAAKLVPGTGVLPGALRATVGYQATAPALAALSAGSEGRRLEAAGEAATDPLGLLTAAAAGALPEVPGAVKAAGRRAVDKATDSAAKWVVKDAIGDIKGASTATARKQLADDARTVPKLVLGDRELDDAITTARAGGIDEINAAKEIVKDRLDQYGRRLSPGWADIDASLPKPITSGDVVNHLETTSQELRDTGLRTKIAEADALDSIVNDIRGAKSWGASKVKELDPKAAADVADLEKIRPNVRDPAAAKQVDEQIAALKNTATTRTKFDPNTPISMEKLQQLWADHAGIAYDSHGGINGTVAFKHKIDVAANLRELRDNLLDEAARNNPRAVGAIEDDLRSYSGLKRIEQVLDQRANHAMANAEGASVTPTVRKAIKVVKHPEQLLGHALEGVVEGKRTFDKAIARHGAELRSIFEKGPGRGARVTAAIAAGVPRKVAMWAAEQASRGMSFDEASKEEGP